MIPTNSEATPTTTLPALLRLPVELRLQIYSYLLIITPADPLASAQFLVSHPDYADTAACQSLRASYATADLSSSTSYEAFVTSSLTPASDEHPTPTSTERILHFRNTSLLVPTPIPLRCTHYKIRADRFRARCVDATYICINSTANHQRIHASLLSTSRQIHAEAAPLLYGSYTFAFDTNIEAARPFFGDLTPRSRQAVRGLSLVKRALPYDKDFDRCEWSSACTFLAANLTGLERLRIGVVAGVPRGGWDDVVPFKKEEFPCLIKNLEEMSWVRDLEAFAAVPSLKVEPLPEVTPLPEVVPLPMAPHLFVSGVTAESQLSPTTPSRAEMHPTQPTQDKPPTNTKRLKTLEVLAHKEHCPAPTSSSMAFFVAFSKSVESGFGEYLVDRLLGPTPAFGAGTGSGSG